MTWLVTERSLFFSIFSRSAYGLKKNKSVPLPFFVFISPPFELPKMDRKFRKVPMWRTHAVNGVNVGGYNDKHKFTSIVRFCNHNDIHFINCCANMRKWLDRSALITFLSTQCLFLQLYFILYDFKSTFSDWYVFVVIVKILSHNLFLFSASHTFYQMSDNYSSCYSRCWQHWCLGDLGFFRILFKLINWFLFAIILCSPFLQFILVLSHSLQI